MPRFQCLLIQLPCYQYNLCYYQIDYLALGVCADLAVERSSSDAVQGAVATMQCRAQQQRCSAGRIISDAVQGAVAAMQCRAHYQRCSAGRSNSDAVQGAVAAMQCTVQQQRCSAGDRRSSSQHRATCQRALSLSYHGYEARKGGKPKCKQEIIINIKCCIVCKYLLGVSDF